MRFNIPFKQHHFSLKNESDKIRLIHCELKIENKYRINDDKYEVAKHENNKFPRYLGGSISAGFSL